MSGSKKDIKDKSGNKGDEIYVFANLPYAQSFSLPDGRKIKIEGVPVSDLKNADGTPIAGGKYGITAIDASEWNHIKKIYGNMRMFESGLVFDAPSVERGQAMAKERSALRHSLEPADPARAKTTPASERE